MWIEEYARKFGEVQGTLSESNSMFQSLRMQMQQVRECRFCLHPYLFDSELVYLCGKKTFTHNSHAALGQSDRKRKRATERAARKIRWSDMMLALTVRVYLTPNRMKLIKYVIEFKRQYNEVQLKFITLHQEVSFDIRHGCCCCCCWWWWWWCWWWWFSSWCSAMTSLWRTPSILKPLPSSIDSERKWNPCAVSLVSITSNLPSQSGAAAHIF